MRNQIGPDKPRNPTGRGPCGKHHCESSRQCVPPPIPRAVGQHNRAPEPHKGAHAQHRARVRGCLWVPTPQIEHHPLAGEEENRKVSQLVRNGADKGKCCAEQHRHAQAVKIPQYVQVPPALRSVSLCAAVMALLILSGAAVPSLAPYGTVIPWILQRSATIGGLSATMVDAAFLAAAARKPHFRLVLPAHLLFGAAALALLLPRPL